MSTRLALRISIVLIAVAAGLGLVAAAAVGVSAAFMPGCAGCHLEGDFETATSEAPHRDVACDSCHGGTTIGSRIEFGSAQVFGMYLKLGSVDPALAATQPAQCDACHAENIGVTVESAGLRIAHSTCATTRECTACHSATAHGRALSWPRSASMEMCFDCHGTDAVPSRCDMCHAARLPEDRIKTGPFRVTHGPEYLKTHGMGRMRTCAPCHEETKCAGCHGAGVPHSADFVLKHPEPAVASDAKCTSCHLETFCTDCHQTPMPHTIEFRKSHATEVMDSGEDLCARCHAKEDCVQCHLDHVHPVQLEQLEQMGIGSGDGS